MTATNLFVNCLVCRRPKGENDIGRNRRTESTLGHHDPDRFFRGVRPPRRTETAIPAVLARSRCRTVAVADNAHAKTPTAIVPEAGKRRRGFLSGCELVGRDRFDRRPRQDALAAVLSFVEQHLAEGEVVVGGRNQPAAAVSKRRRAARLAVLDVVVQYEGPPSPD